MGIRLDKPWQPLEASSLERIGGQLGVYQLADDTGRILYIGAASAHSLQGLRGELQARVGTAARFRIEITTAYWTRRQELLMAHMADHGRYPEQNTENDIRGLGRLSP